MAMQRMPEPWPVCFPMRHGPRRRMPMSLPEGAKRPTRSSDCNVGLATGEFPPKVREKPGAPLKAVQELLGHSTIEMTTSHAHLSPDVRKDAVRLLDAGPPDNGVEFEPNYLVVFVEAPGVEDVSQPRYFGGLHRLPRACRSFREVWSVRVWEGWIGLGNRWARRSRRPSGSNMPRVNWRGEIQLGKTKRAVSGRNG
jgi:hypothetical protein